MAQFFLVAVATLWVLWAIWSVCFMLDDGVRSPKLLMGEFMVNLLFAPVCIVHAWWTNKYPAHGKQLVWDKENGERVIG